MPAPQTEVLITIGGKEHARHLLTPGDYVIGRNSDCPIRVEADLVSRQHAKLILNYDHALIEDLGSSNGTQVNGQPIAQAERTRLWPNQKIQIGTATIELRRLQSDAPSDMSLAPAQRAVRDMLPAELLREKKYDIGAVVARGGMGAILDAKEAAIKRRVAMKVMLDTNDAGDIARFVAEAQVTGQLEHPNIVPVHELGVDENGQVFYTMQMVRGITLKKVLELLAKGVAETVKKFPLSALLTVFQKVCDAIAFAHSKGVIHRDLKPENLLLGDFGSVLVMDWGLAKVLDPNRAAASVAPGQDLRSIVHTAPGDANTGSMTLTGTIMGTPQYMAPEQARGEIETLDARTDIYALGAILFHILFLRTPVSGSDAMQIVGKVGRGEVEWPAAKELRAAPDSLLAVCRKALALDPAARYPRVEDLQADLLAYQNGFATSAEKAGAWKQFTLLIKRHKATSIGLAALLLVSIGFTAKVIAEGKRAERGEVLAKTEAKRANAALADLKASAPSLLALAESEAGFQRFDSALVKLDAALALDPALTAGWWRRAWLLLGMARYGEAPAAFRTAQQRDPAQHAHDALLPVLDAIAAAPDDATRFPPERTEALFRHFTKVGASGELNALSKRLTFGAKQKEQMVRQRLDEWLGKGVGYVEVQPDGTIRVFGVPAATDTLEPLRGLPIGNIALGNTAVNSLEPLRGMALTQISLDRTRISDLSPLRGMPITELHADGSDISDLTPLAGMPLRVFDANGTKISDLSPLRGAPLEEFHVNGNRIVDFSPLRGAPLTKVKIGGNQCSDLSFLADSPALEYLYCSRNSIADLSPLRGKPLKFLDTGGNRITDLRPLAGLPLTELNIDIDPIADFAPLRELRQLQKLYISKPKNSKVSLEPLRQHPSLQYIAVGGAGPYRPVADFWPAYDAQQAAEKK